jgi:alpha-beta hydrolase superfamily lysophospholipase
VSHRQTNYAPKSGSAEDEDVDGDGSAALQPARHDERMDTYSRDDLTFDVLDEGPSGGPVVVLLHGFPQQNTSWNTVIPRLTEESYRCLAPNQRGYSRTARPRAAGTIARQSLSPTSAR